MTRAARLASVFFAVIAFGGAPSVLAVGEARPYGREEAVTRETYLGAAQALLGRIKAMEGSVPSISDPLLTEFLSQAASAAVLVGTPAMPMGKRDLEALCGPANEVVGAYMTSGLSSLYSRRRDMPRQEWEAALQKIGSENVGKYLDTLFPVIMFATSCGMADWPNWEAALSVAPHSEVTILRTSSAQRERDEEVRRVRGLLNLLVNESTKPNHAALIVDVLSLRARDLALVLTPAQRRQLATEVTILRNRIASDYTARLNAFITAMDRPDCGRICSS